MVGRARDGVPPRASAVADLVAWQTRFLPVYAAWAAVVALVFPPVFGFV
nr:hypothetical protein [Cellulosimicrobium sp. MM]